MSQAGANSSNGGGGGGNSLSGNATSEDGSTETVINFELDSTATVYRFEFMVTGRDTSSGDGLGYHLFASAKTDGAAATLIQSEFIDADEEASLMDADINFVPSGNFMQLQVTGVAGTTIDYIANGSYIAV